MFNTKRETPSPPTSVADRLTPILFSVAYAFAAVDFASIVFEFLRNSVPTEASCIFLILSIVSLFFLFVQLRRQQTARRAIVNELTTTNKSFEDAIARMTIEANDTNALMELVSVHFNELFRRIPAPCFCFGSDGRFKEWNAAFETLTLIEPTFIINEAVSKYVRVDNDSEKMKILIASVFDGETFEGIELQTSFMDGPDKTLLCNMFPLRGEGGLITAAVCAGIDITERIRMEQRMINHVEMLSAAQQKLEEQQDELLLANEQLEMLAMCDSLTGLKNHRALQERLGVEYKRSIRYGSPVSVLLLDVDKFKKYNDSYGHLAGDCVLRTVGDILGSSMRDTDFVARYGGEEFVVVLPHTDYMGALEAAERIRAAIEMAPWELIRITVSIGVATLRPDMVRPADLIAKADIALYYCKQHGRNQVIHAQDLSESLLSAEPVLDTAFSFPD